MATKTIPQLNSISQVDQTDMTVIDTGVQTFKITAQDLAKGLRKFSTPNPGTPKSEAYLLTVNDALLMVDSTLGSFDISLPDPATFINSTVKILDVAGKLSLNKVTLKRHATELISGVSADFFLESDFGSWEIYSNGSNWFVI